MNNKFNDLRANETNTLKDYITLIRLNLVPILVISFAGLLVSIFYALNAQNIYKSTTMVKMSKPQGGGILEAPLIPEFQEWGNDRFIANEIEVLKSYTVREIVANSLIDSFKAVGSADSFYLILNHELNLSESENIVLSIQSIINIFDKKVSIDQKRGLDMVEISVESPSPFEAALIANCYADSYKELNLHYNRQQLITVKDFLSEQRKEKLAELNNAEEALKEYQEKGGIFELSEQAKSLIEQLSDFEAKQSATKLDLTISEKSLTRYKSELQRQDPRLSDYLESFATEPYLKSLQEQIAQKETQKDVAVASSQDSRKRKEIITQYDSQISELRNKLNSKIEVYKAGIFASSPEEIKQLSQKILEEEIKVQSLEASYKELSAIVTKYEAKFNTLPERTIDLARLERERSAFEKLYLIVEEKYQEALINEQSTPGNVLIIDTARRAQKPSKPNRMLIVIVGLFLGVGLGFGFAFIRNYFDNTVKTPEDIQNKNINVLAWIPHIEGIGTDSKKEFEFIVAKKPDSIPSEAYRALRTRIQFYKIDRDAHRTILITSSAPKEGKTSVSINLAGSFALTDKRALILDCDLRKPRMHTIFKDERFPGFTDYFFGQSTYEQIVRKSEITNLDYITAGTIPPNPSEILGSPQMEAFLRRLREEYDHIVIDSPPIIAVTDSEILSRLVDMTILVVSANVTEVDLMEKSVELLTHEQGSFAGVLLNNFSYKSGYGSYYKYYYYYSRPQSFKQGEKINV